MTEALRPTKKQREILTFIESFIGEHGYSPSYREIMNGLQYTSVATVALHVNSLIKRGHLRKRDRSARSLEVVKAQPDEIGALLIAIKPSEEKWLIARVDSFIKQLETKDGLMDEEIDHLFVVIGALKVLGFDDAARSFIPRLTELKSLVAK